jgi:two-component sensor histidine kinase
VTSSISATASAPGQFVHGDDLLLRETNHRCSNDLQLVVSLLALQSQRAATPEAREALVDAMERVSVLANARRIMHRDRPPTLDVALRQVCEALQAQAEPRSILISLHVTDEPRGLPANHVTTLSLVVNELVTNAIKHAFAEGKSGYVRVTITRKSGEDITILVDDDGLPLPPTGGSGLGMGIAKRLMASIDGLLIQPEPGSKVFELRVPVKSG